MLAKLPVLTRLREVAEASPAVAIEIALALLPFWPNGLLSRDLTAYVAGLAVTLIELGRERLT